MRKKKFDCVEMQHQAQDQIYEETKHMTREELLAYWQQADREFVEKRRRLQAPQRKSA